MINPTCVHTQTETELAHVISMATTNDCLKLLIHLLIIFV